MRPEYWSFSFSISPSNEYSGLISFKIDWFDLLVVQLTVWVICIDGNDLLNDTIPYSDASINLYGKKSSCGFFKFNPELPMKIHDFVPVFQSQILNNLSSIRTAPWLSVPPRCRLPRLAYLLGSLPELGPSACLPW